VAAQKIDLSKAEQMVHNYIENNSIAFEEKKAAATLIQNAWLKFKSTRSTNKSSCKRFFVKRNLILKVQE